MAGVPFERFCEVLDTLFLKRRSRQEQDRLLLDFFNEVKIKNKTGGAKDSSIFPVLRLLLPDLERERSAYNLKEAKLGMLLVKVLSIPKKSNDGQKLLNFRAVTNSQEGCDFASVAYYVLNSRIGTKSCTLTVGDINDLLDKIAAAEIGNKGPILDEAFTTVLKNTTAKQAKWFLRIVLKDLKLSIGKTRILSALHPDAPEFYERCSNLLKVCDEFDEGSTRPLELGIELFTAVSPMLSERMDITRFSFHQDKEYHIEEKFDGERFQIHMKDGVFEYFSRKGYKYSSNYGKTYDSGLLTPSLRDCFSPGVNSFVMDGEMMGWHKQFERFGSKGMSFDVKKITENSRYKPCFCAFDLLYYNGKTLVGDADRGGMPLSERLRLLDGIFTDKAGVIQHSRRDTVKEKSELIRALNEIIEKEQEGLVLKECDSYYIVNRRNAGWYKIKPEYTEGTMSDLDLVVIGADYAENKKQGLAKSFHVACVDRSAEGTRWLGVGRAATGLSFEEREQVCATLASHWTHSRQAPHPDCLVFNKEKPDLWVMPQHSVVFTVRATELIRSTDYGTEYTLRFPRIVKIRDDKPIDDVMTLQDFDKLVADRAPVKKLSTNTINQFNTSAPLVRRKRTAKVLQVAEQFRTRPRDQLQVKSKALEGRKICILSEDEDCSKTELESLVLSHGGVVVQNISSDTWCAVYGRMNVRVRNQVRAQQADITSSTWLRALPPADLPCPPPAPLDLLVVKDATRLKLARDYDIYGDSYRDSIDSETLKRIFDKMDRDKEPAVHLTTQEMIELDQELFAESNPHAFLRQCFIHVRDELFVPAMKARYFGAKLCQLESPNLTHVVVTEETRAEILEDIEKKGIKAPVVSEEWLDACFAEGQFVSESPYLLN